MDINGKRLAGLLLIIGAVQFILAVTVAQSLYPGYSDRQALSDLGVGSTSLIFNVSVILLGLTVIAAGLLVRNTMKHNIFGIIMVIDGACAMGVGIFPETTGLTHMTFALIAFLFGGIAALFASVETKFPQNMLYFLIGTFSILVLILGLRGFSFGLGFGGMERLVVYPIILWEIMFGALLLS